jgi:acetolactate synthase-1/2/3 large subunit
MKVTDFILDFLVSHGVTTVFGITGGFISPLFDAFHGRTDIHYINTQHEQAAAMAADGYARFKGFGCAIATSGPGATNLVTGIAASWFDSIPVLFITGQVNTKEAAGTSGVRQRGFQETDITSIVKSITKFSCTVNKATQIAFWLECAFWNMTNGRPGPALLDIPINILLSEIDPNTLNHYEHSPMTYPIKQDDISQVVRMIAEAKRPVVVYGNGARHAKKELIEFIEKTGIPCVASWAGLDIIPHDHPLFVERIGVYGHRAANLTVQNSDLLIAIGTRLDTRMTGAKGFAPKAKKVVVDIDIAEAYKCKPDLMIIADAGEFLRAIIPEITVMLHHLYDADPYEGWKIHIGLWKQKYQITDPNPSNYVLPYQFIRQLNDLLPDDAIVVTDAGAAQTWTEQIFHVRGTQRIFSDFGMSCMGYSIPAAMGASLATGRPVVVIIGDGAMQMNIQELQTLAHYQIPVKVFILNNHSYGMIKQFQEEIFEGRYEATVPQYGYSTPDFEAIADAYKVTPWNIRGTQWIEYVIKKVMEEEEPIICNVEIDPAARVFPKCTFGNPLHNQSPLLPPEEVTENMRD